MLFNQRTDIDILSVLKQARKLIEKPGQWTQNALARDVNGKDVDPLSSDAVRYCSLGAIDNIDLGEAGNGAHRALSITAGVGDIFAVYNDSHNHAEVLAVWDKTIMLLEGNQ